MMSLLGLLPSPPAKVSTGLGSRFEGPDLLRCTPTQLRAIHAVPRSASFFSRSHDLAEPGIQRGLPNQRGAAAQTHMHMDKAAARQRARLLELVGIPMPSAASKTIRTNFPGVCASVVDCHRPGLRTPKVWLPTGPPPPGCDHPGAILGWCASCVYKLGMAIDVHHHDLGVVAGITSSTAPW